MRQTLVRDRYIIPELGNIVGNISIGFLSAVAIVAHLGKYSFLRVLGVLADRPDFGAISTKLLLICIQGPALKLNPRSRSIGLRRGD